MHLHKWNAKYLALLKNVNNENSGSYLFLGTETKALGVKWNPKLDIFKVKIVQPKKVTKRSVFSDIA